MDHAVDANDTANQLVIRVKVANNQQASSSNETEYDIGKIILAIIALVMIVGLVGFAIYVATQEDEATSLASQQEKSVVEGKEAPATSTAVTDNNQSAEKIVKLDEAKLPAEASPSNPIQSSVEKVAQGEESSSAKQASPSDKSQGITPSETKPEQEMRAMVEEEKTPTKTPATDRASANPDSNSAAKTPTSQQAAFETKSSPNVLDQIGNLAESSTEYVRRSVFTSGINQREPVDQLGTVISGEPKTVAQVYYFSELRDLKGKTVTHRWLYEGNVESEIRFQVGGNRWRVNSSKRLSYVKTGEWQVQVVDSQNQVLATKSFLFEIPTNTN